MMHGNGSGSAVSRHQSWAEIPGHKVSMTSLHWQTSLQIQKGHALMQLHQWLVNELGSLCMEIISLLAAIGGLTNRWNFALQKLMVLWKPIVVEWSSIFYFFRILFLLMCHNFFSMLQSASQLMFIMCKKSFVKQNSIWINKSKLNCKG